MDEAVFRLWTFVDSREADGGLPKYGLFSPIRMASTGALFLELTIAGVLIHESANSSIDQRSCTCAAARYLKPIHAIDAS